MLKLFFNRSSYAVRLMEVIGVTFSILYLKEHFYPLTITSLLFLFLIITYLFIRICDWIPWYALRNIKGKRSRDVGIRVHFEKSLVPTSYILAITSLVCFLGIPILSFTLLVISVLMMMVIAPVNAILVHFHSKDTDPLPINHFSANDYLQVGWHKERFLTAVQPAGKTFSK